MGEAKVKASVGLPHSLLKLSPDRDQCSWTGSSASVRLTYRHHAGALVWPLVHQSGDAYDSALFGGSCRGPRPAHIALLFYHNTEGLMQIPGFSGNVVVPASGDPRGYSSVCVPLRFSPCRTRVPSPEPQASTATVDVSNGSPFRRSLSALAPGKPETMFCHVIRRRKRLWQDRL